MSSAPDLGDRIVAVLQRESSSPAAIASVITDAEVALTQARDELAHVRQVALDPLTPAAEVAEHRRRAIELQFVIERLEAGLERLRERHAAAVERAAKEAREREHVELTVERDRVAAKLSEVYRRAAAEVAGVLDEAVRTNRRVTAWNGTGGPWIAELPQLHRGVRLPALGAGEAFWPPADRLDAEAMIPAELIKLSEARAAAAKELAEARAAWEEAHRLHPQRRRVPV